MAICTAQKTGNWSDATVWDTVPGSGDTVRPASYTVTVDVDINIGSGTLEGTSTGYFSVTAARNITANVLSSTGHTGGGVLRASNSTGTVAVTGNINGGANIGAALSAAGTLSVIGNVTGGSTGSSYGLNNSSTGTINITGDVSGSSAAASYGCRNATTGTVAVTGNINGGSNATAYGVYNVAGGTVTCTGTATGGSLAHGAYNNSTGTMSVKRAKGGSAVDVLGLYGKDSGGTTTWKELEFSANGQTPVGGFTKMVVDQTVNLIVVKRSDTGADYNMSNDYPAVGDVKSGTVYNRATMTGTYAAGSVIVIED